MPTDPQTEKFFMKIKGGAAVKGRRGEGLRISARPIEILCQGVRTNKGLPKKNCVEAEKKKKKRNRERRRERRSKRQKIHKNFRGW